MRTDHLFYKLFATFPQTLFELLGIEVPEGTYRFDSSEVKETAFRIDGVYVPNQPDQPTYFVEVQMQLDRNIYWRLCTELILYMGNFAPQGDWRAVLIFPSSSQDVQVSPALRELVDSSRFIRVYLDTLHFDDTVSPGLTLVQLIVEPESTFVERAQQAVQRTRSQLKSAEARRAALELIETIIVYKLQYDREELEAMFGLEELKQTRYFQQVAAEAAQKGWQEGHDNGHQEGRQEGRQEGQLLGEYLMLLRLLTRKFGELPAELVRQIETTTDRRQLEQWFDVALGADDLKSFLDQR